MKLAALAVVAAACGAPAPVCELPKSAARGAPYLWTVEKAGAPGKVVLFGTIHTVAASDLPPAVFAALAAAERYASELGDADPDVDKFAERARLEHGSLKAMLSPDDWWTLEDTMRGTMKSAELEHARPWFAMVKLMGKVAPGAKPSMDEALTARAKEQHKAIAALETWDAQLAALDKEVQVKDLADAIHARGDIACSQDQTKAAYLAADDRVLAAKLAVDTSHLVSERNAVWQPEVEQMVARPGVTFVAVGLGHLLGAGGLPARLAKAGYTVHR